MGKGKVFVQAAIALLGATILAAISFALAVGISMDYYARLYPNDDKSGFGAIGCGMVAGFLVEVAGFLFLFWFQRRRSSPVSNLTSTG